MFKLLPKTQLCTHTLLDGNIHELYFAASSQSAVDEMFAYMGSFPPASAHQTVRLLLDWSDSGLLPLTYMFQQARHWVSQMSVLAPARIAICYSDNFPLVMAETFFRMVRFNINYEVRFFPREQRTQALNWLMEE